MATADSLNQNSRLNAVERMLPNACCRTHAVENAGFRNSIAKFAYFADAGKFRMRSSTRDRRLRGRGHEHEPPVLARREGDGDESAPAHRYVTSFKFVKGPNFGIFLIFANFLCGLVLGCITTNFARKYAFHSIFQALQELHPFAQLQSQNFPKKSI